MEECIEDMAVGGSISFRGIGVSSFKFENEAIDFTFLMRFDMMVTVQS